MEENKNMQPGMPKRPPAPPKPPMPPRPPVNKPAPAPTPASVPVQPKEQEKVKEVEIKKPEKTEKAKPEKVKKEKVKKEKKEKVKLSKKVKTILALSFAGAIVLAAGITTLVFYLQAIKQLDKPTNLVVNNAGEYVFAECDRTERAERYLFEINNGTTTYILPETKAPKADLTQYMNKVGEYTVKVRAVGKNDKSASEYMSITYTYKHKLNTPTIYLDNDAKQISFIPVLNTTKYAIYYETLDNDPVIITHNSNENVVCDITDILEENGLGYCNIKVKAIPDNSNYVESDFSNEVVACNTIKLNPVSDITYNKDSKVISFVSPDTKFEITLKIQSINSVREVVFEYEEITKIVDLKPYNVVGNGESVVEIKIVALGEGFTLNSEPTTQIIV